VGPLDALWHLLNFFAPALAVGAVTAGLVKLLWRQQLKTVTWRRLATWAAGASALALVAGLVLTGRDGKVVTWGAMVVANTLALGWAAFGPRRA
jgi:hypothetical protein